VRQKGQGAGRSDRRRDTARVRAYGGPGGKRGAGSGGPTDGSSSDRRSPWGRWSPCTAVGGWLADRGITGELTLIVGSGFGSDGGREGLDSPMLVEGFLRAVVVSVGNAPAGATEGVVHLGGGPDQVIALLDQQLARRAAHRVPHIDRDPA